MEDDINKRKYLTASMDMLAVIFCLIVEIFISENSIYHDLKTMREIYQNLFQRNIHTT
jgi:hypothetical protein